MAQPPSTLDADTLQPPSRPAFSLPARCAVLTIAFHPDLARCGDRAVLVSLPPEGVGISRAEPSFLDAGGRSTGPLHDAHVSRAPMRIGKDGTGLVVDASAIRGGIDVDGTRVTGARSLSASELERGITITLAGAVVLVLRVTPPSRGARAEHGLIGTSHEIDVVRSDIDVAARHADPVLILGESGTGKELVAAAIHRASARASKPFLAVNMATLAGSTAAAELFGHSRGAFTGAEGAHDGFFGRADGGTLFLDEIGDAGALVQPMLLRALESGEITPVGGRGVKKIDVRVIAATDHDIHQAAESGEFRLPLLHRLAAHSIALAPLRERREDVLPLLVRFLREEDPGVSADVLPIELARELVARPWPGNVRELRNVARTLARQGAGAFAKTASRAPSAPDGAPGPDVSDADLVATLRRNEFRIGATARELGIAKNTLYKRMERCALLRRARDLDEREIRAAWTAQAGDIDGVAARLEVSARALQLRMRELGIEVP